jgi:hypothetical protein
MTLAEIEEGAGVFVDATIFVYHFFADGDGEHYRDRVPGL